MYSVPIKANSNPSPRDDAKPIPLLSLCTIAMMKSDDLLIVRYDEFTHRSRSSSSDFLV